MLENDESSKINGISRSALIYNIRKSFLFGSSIALNTSVKLFILDLQVISF